MNKSVKAIFIILIILFICIFCYAGYRILSPFFEEGGYIESAKNYEQIQQNYVKESSGKEKNNDGEVSHLFNPPQQDEICPIEVDFEALRQQNSDVVGWVYCPDTVINYPICQCDDNMWYLHRDINSNYSSYGTLFVDFQCQKDFDNYNTLVYGHHMNDGKMFAKLVDYKYQSYYQEHPVMYLLTPEMNYRIDIFAGYTTSMNSDTYMISFDSQENYANWLGQRIEMSDFKQESIVPDTNHATITLSTCTYDYDDARYVIHGMLVPIH